MVKAAPNRILRCSRRSKVNGEGTAQGRGKRPLKGTPPSYLGLLLLRYQSFPPLVPILPHDLTFFNR